MVPAPLMLLKLLLIILIKYPIFLVMIARPVQVSMTVWFERMFFQTDQYETNQQYPVRANLYVSEVGFLTTRRPSPIHPAVGMVTAPPTPMNPMIEILWF